MRLVDALPASILLLAPSLAVAGVDGDVDQEEGVRLSAQLIGWGTLYDMDRDPQADPATYGDLEADPGIALRRATLGLEGRRGHLEWDLEIGHSQRYDALSPASPLLTLFDAYGAWNHKVGPGRFRFVVGQARTPFSGEILSSSSELLFQERSPAAEWLGGGREPGVIVDYQLDAGIRARVGVQNGVPDLDGDVNLGKRLSARVEFIQGEAPDATGRVGLGSMVNVGIAAMHDDDIATSTNSVAADARLRLGGLAVNGEFIRAQLRPSNVDVAEPTVQAGTVRMGANLQVSWLFPLKHGGLEVGARGAWFDDAAGKADNGDVGVLHVGLSRRNALPGFDYGLGYIHREELGGSKLPNDTVRAWVQLYDKVRLDAHPTAHAPAVPKEEDVPAEQQPFIGTWYGSGALEGGVIRLWNQPNIGLVGTFLMHRPMGHVEVERPYPLEGFTLQRGTLTVQLRPYSTHKDVVWFELHPDPSGKLCGLVYDDGKREAAADGKGGGATVCWTTPANEN